MTRRAKTGVRPLAEFIDGCLSPALAAQGFATSDVILAWPEIVGDKLAGFTQPVKLEWPRRSAPADPDERAAPASLVVRVESAFALDLQHLAPVVIDRINTYFGWKCVGKLVLKQGPVHKQRATKTPPPPLTPQEEARIHDAVDSVEDDDLRDALQRLGATILAENKRLKT